VRELLATEMLEALGVNTSKSFSLIETGEALQRHDEPSPTRAAVLIRLSHGHIRIGSFQRLAALGDVAGLKRLTEYVLLHYFGEAPDADPAARLLGLVAERTATLAANYITAGFVHGVLNSDNINVTGESFDYGPWRWNPTWDGNFTAAYFDHYGLYCFARQPEAIQWNLRQLAHALLPLSSIAALTPAFQAFGPAYEAALATAMLARLGIMSHGEQADRALIQAIEQALAASQVGIDRFFFDWRGGTRRQPSPADALYDGEAFADFRSAISDYQALPNATTHAYWHDAEPCTMLIDEVERIWAAIATDDDWRPLEDKIAAVRQMGIALAG
jgi:serine/tyrosine/threonine adenylyltransferase